MVLAASSFAADLHYSLVKKESGKEGSTLLVVGGIHGDEPGGYFAPMLLSRYYKIESGNVWVIPNLNFDSIVKNRRGINGDMNRKFAKIDPKDKDLSIVNDIKKLILNPKVDLTLNLHDGQGFYREKNINKEFNSRAWGQATIIDQQSVPNAKYGNLAEIAKSVSQETNVALIEDVHEFNVKNTNTQVNDKDMQQSLTFFAINNSKPAFGIETSKNITDLSQKVYYQLRTIEKFMNVMNIKYSRSFELSQPVVKQLLQNDGILEIPPTKITLDLSTLKSTINFFPMDKRKLDYKCNNPLVAVVKDKDVYRIMNGNRVVSTLKPDYIEFESSLDTVTIVVDGQPTKVKIGSVVTVKHDFEVSPIKGYRVNVIGYSKPNVENESGIKLEHKDIAKAYAIDKSESTYMVHFYKDKKFSGIVNIQFDNASNRK